MKRELVSVMKPVSIHIKLSSRSSAWKSKSGDIHDTVRHANCPFGFLHDTAFFQSGAKGLFARGSEHITNGGTFMIGILEIGGHHT